jgi:cysteine dioxygenase
MTGIGLNQFLTFLDQLTAEDFAEDKLTDYLKDHRVNPEELLRFAYFREDTYGRNLIKRTDNYEVLLLNWLPGQRTPIHDHAGQRCWMWVHTGELIITHYESLDEDGTELVPTGTPEKLTEESLIYLDDPLKLHVISNPTKRPAISLHIYSKPFDQCAFFNESSKKIEGFPLEYFTQTDA